MSGCREDFQFVLRSSAIKGQIFISGESDAEK